MRVVVADLELVDPQFVFGTDAADDEIPVAHVVAVIDAPDDRAEGDMGRFAGPAAQHVVGEGADGFGEGAGGGGHSAARFQRCPAARA